MNNIDFIGNVVQIGDYVAFARNPYSNIILGKVVGYTPKGFRIIRKNRNGEWNSEHIGNWDKEYETIGAYQCAKIIYNEGVTNE